MWWFIPALLLNELSVGFRLLGMLCIEFLYSMSVRKTCRYWLPKNFICIHTNLLLIIIYIYYMKIKLELHLTGAMRAAPISLFCYSSSEQELVDTAKDMALLTHANRLGYNGTVLQVIPERALYMLRVLNLLVWSITISVLQELNTVPHLWKILITSVMEYLICRRTK